MKKILSKVWSKIEFEFWLYTPLVLAFLLGVVLTAAFFLLKMPRGSDKLAELAAVLDHYYVEDVDPLVLEDGAAAGMVAALGDRWSLYMTKEEYEADQATMNGRYVGVGITISLQEDGSSYRIIKVEPGAPAEEAGLLVGDLLIGADGLTVAEDGPEAVKNAVAGEKGTTVELSLLRNGKPLTLTCRRDAMKVDLVQGELLEGNIGLIRISAFRTGCAEDAIDTMDDLMAQGAKGIIFDVRNNPGGYTTEMNEILDYLLPAGPLFRMESYDGKTTVERSDAFFVDIPTAVLVNGQSYSGAEFFAAALQEYEAAVIVGEKTTGKGYYQTNIELADGSAAHISVGKYFTPNGVSLTDLGVTPDREVPVDEATAREIYNGKLAFDVDPQILAAIEELKPQFSGN